MTATMAEVKRLREERIQKRYTELSSFTKDYIEEAIQWAITTLTEEEGSGHYFIVTAHRDGELVECSFAKPEWGGDHVGRGMEHAAEAIVMAVCEYMEGA